jgi:hypothetical protein
MLWGWSFATCELIVKFALWIAFVAGGLAAVSAFIAGWIAVAAGVIAALSAFIAGYVGLRLSGAIQKEADLRIAEAQSRGEEATARAAIADQRAGEAQLALEQFKAPRTLSREQQQHVAEKMSPYKGHRVVVGAVPLTNESSGLASEILEALKLKPAEVDAFMNQVGVAADMGAAGPNGKLIQEPITKGVQVKFTTGNDKAQKFADALAAALNDESITAFALSGLHEDTMAGWISQGLDRNSEINEPVTIVVGEKP